ncbi:MAG: Asp-tRNA(Asn)/Glu-tRNA(Gln) amidotransferase subunit GatB [Flavobacteriales bacterium]|nr:Asp-tRNA(Asn)/Glu-tRNA(Gln) amidotransferase subunit GatB [Flavobacteriales bacterium]
MNSIYDKYEAVIGLEVHAQLLTRSKNFSADKNEYGAIPNTNVSVISLGHPGTLPRLNKKSIEFAVRLGIACEAEIRSHMHFARKNYFYADLPKGYQITQDTTPICEKGFIMIKDENGNDKKINLIRIHIEEDAGKSIHDVDPFDTLVDLNRAGVPLLEIVSAPDIKTAKEAYNYLTEVRKLIRYLDICDGNMEEGSMRCDANISVMLKGSEKFGTRAEVKNMNSIRNVQRAIEFEIKRQIELIESGGTVVQETRSFDAVSGGTISMRSKEMAHDYRYFPEPDLPPVTVTSEYIQEVKNHLPPLPAELFKRYTSEFGLSEYDAYQLTDHKSVALFFEELIKHTKNYKSAANWIMGDVRSWLNENGKEIEEFPLSPAKIADLIALIDSGKVSHTVAAQSIFPVLISSPEKTPLQIAEENNLIQESDQDALLGFIHQAIENIGPAKLAEYKGGKKGLVGLYMGEVMKLSKGKADPKNTNQLLIKTLDEK